MAKQYYGDLEKVFLADGDALALDCRDLRQIIADLYRSFPGLRHVGIYAGPRTILQKTDAELEALKAAGLTIAYLGVETGDERLLKEINKGVTCREMVAAGQKITGAGIQLSVTILLGLAGRGERSFEHARATALIGNEINPDFLAALTLMVEPGTPLYRSVQQGEFQVPEPLEIIQELRVLIENLDLDHCVFRSNHASNYLPLKGTLPQDKDRMLGLIDGVLRRQDRQLLRPESLRGL